MMFRRLQTLALPPLVWLSSAGFALAQDRRGTPPPDWVIGYTIFGLGMLMGLIVVCRMNKRRDFKPNRTADDI